LDYSIFWREPLSKYVKKLKTRIRSISVQIPLNAFFALSRYTWRIKGLGLPVFWQTMAEGEST
jgi:hypothetical protein